MRNSQLVLLGGDFVTRGYDQLTTLSVPSGKVFKGPDPKPVAKPKKGKRK